MNFSEDGQHPKAAALLYTEADSGNRISQTTLILTPWFEKAGSVVAGVEMMGKGQVFTHQRAA